MDCIITVIDGAKELIANFSYVNLWTSLFDVDTFLNGFWSRLFAAVCLFLAFWYGVYRQKFGLGTILFAMAIAFTYLSGVIGSMFWWAT
jgi:hypothetical protein